MHTLDGSGNSAGVALGPGKPLALLAYCLHARNREHSRDMLASLLWSDVDPVRARQNVRQALWRVRQIVGECVRITDTFVGGIDRRIISDREEFYHALSSGDARRVFDIYGGPFLKDVSLPGADEFDDWAGMERRHCEDQLVRAADGLLQATIRESRFALTRGCARRLWISCPNNPDAIRIAADAQFSAGDAPAALEAVLSLESLIRTGDIRSTAAIEASITRVRGAPTHETVVSNSSLTFDLVGRDVEFATAMQCWQRVRDGKGQQLAIKGPAGIGKSRLLSAIAQRCSSKRSRCISIRANFGERELPFAFAAAVARALSQLPGAAGISSESARELVSLDPALSSTFHASPIVQGVESLRRRALAVLDLVSAVAEQTSLAIFVDDVHWIDVASRQMLAVVFGRVADQALFVVGTSRSSVGGLFDDRILTEIQLAALTRAEALDAIASTGEWPDTTEANALMSRIADVCDGVPLMMVEQTSLLEAQGYLTRAGNAWRSDNWTRAIEAVNAASPIDQRLAECSVQEQAVVNLLACAGTPLTEALLVQAVSSQGRARIISTLNALIANGLVTRSGDSYSLGHDLIAERALIRMNAPLLCVVHAQLGGALRSAGDLDSRSAAVRHFMLALQDVQAAHEFREVVREFRAQGDMRAVNQILVGVVGAGLPPERLRSVASAARLWHRVRWPHPAITIAASLLVVLVSATMVWRGQQRPSLGFAQAPLTMEEVPVLGADAMQLVPAAVVSFAQRDQDVRADTTAVMVHVRSMTPGVEIIASDSVKIENGRASFGGLRLRSQGKAGWLRFEAAGFAPLDLRLDDPRAAETSGDEIRLHSRIIRAEVNGALLAQANPIVRVARGAAVSGVVQIEYSSPYRSASVWLSMTPTWGDPSVVGRDVRPVTTPVRDEVFDVAVKVHAPTAPGHYWLLFIIDAEPSGGFTLSQTNWTMERPIWGDGNDVAALPDSVIRTAVGAGVYMSARAFPDTMVNVGCVGAREVAGRKMRYCNRMLGVAGVEVVVE